MEPWEWDEATWRGKVDKVRAGRSLKPKTWKNGARCAVALSFDSDHETNELRDGGESIGRLSWGQYGNRRGVPRILETLKAADVPATFFVPAVAALLHPDEQKRVIAEGHEIGLHGWIHEVNTKVPPEKERELHLRAADTLEKITGVRAVGMRTPSWDFSDVTLEIERELGLIYDCTMEDNGDVKITMTLTAPHCPVAGEMPKQVADAVAAVDGVGEVSVTLTWSPPWRPDMMSEDAKLALDLF